MEEVVTVSFRLCLFGQSLWLSYVSELVKQKGTLLFGQKALEEVLETNRVLNHSPNIELIGMKVYKSLNFWVAFVLPKSATDTVQDALPCANAAILSISYSLDRLSYKAILILDSRTLA